jgi:hypothetical protein
MHAPSLLLVLGIQSGYSAMSFLVFVSKNCDEETRV